MSDYYISRADTSHHEIFPGVHIYTVAGKQMMLSVVELEPGSEVLPHSHPHEQMGMLLEGELTFTIGGETKVLKAGEMWRIPGGVTHGCLAGERGAKALDVFHPIREDYR
jgi:quercetin dioxygenase-like cupin family protein